MPNHFQSMKYMLSAVKFFIPLTWHLLKSILMNSLQIYIIETVYMVQYIYIYIFTFVVGTPDLVRKTANFFHAVWKRVNNFLLM